MKLCLHLTVEPDGGDPVLLASTGDRAAIAHAAAAAVADARHRVHEFAAVDPILAEMQASEVARLSSALRLVVPELAEGGTNVSQTEG